MYDLAGKAFDTMTVAELRAYLSQSEIVEHAAKWNTKTLKADLITIATLAHRSFQNSKGADRLRERLLTNTEVETINREAAKTHDPKCDPLPMTPERERNRAAQLEAYRAFIRGPFKARKGKHKPSKRR